MPPENDVEAAFEARLLPSGKVTLAPRFQPEAALEMDLAHSKPTAVAASPDGTVLCTLHADQSAQLWRTSTREQFAHLPGRTYAWRFSPDSRILATWGGDPFIRLVDLQTGEERKRINGGGDGEPNFQFSPDGRFLATSEAGAAVKVWRVDDGARRLDLDEGFKKISVNPRGHRMASAHRSGEINLWDLTQGRRERTLHHEQWVLGVAFGGDDRLITCGVDKTARVWDLTAGQELHALRHESAVHCAALFGQETRAVSGERLGLVHFWDLKAGAELSRTNPGHSTVINMAISAQNQIALCFMDGTVSLWSGEGVELRVLGRHLQPAFSLAFSPDGSTLLSGGGDRTVRVWDLKTGTQTGVVSTKSAVYDLDFNRDGTRWLCAGGGLLTGLENPRVDVWDTASGREVITFPYAQGQITGARFSADGRRLVSGLDAPQRGARRRSHGFQLESFPLENAEYPGGEGMPLEQRAALFAKEFWKRRQAEESSDRTAAPAVWPASKWPARATNTPQRCVDLSASYNAHLHFPWRPLVSWGEFDHDFSRLPAGLQEFAGVGFDVRGLVVAPPAEPSWQRLALYRRETGPITVGQRARKLHFLHATTFPKDEMQGVGAYVLEFEDGQKQEIALNYGREIRAWRTGSPETSACSEAEVAWERQSSRLYKWTWLNPHPEQGIRSLRIHDGNGAAPFLVGLSIE